MRAHTPNVITVISVVCNSLHLHIQCLRKASRPWLFPRFVMLQPYSKMDKIVFSLINPQVDTMQHNDKANTGLQTCKMYAIKITEIWHLHKYSDPLLRTLLKHIWQRLQHRVLLDLMLQAWHSCTWGVSPILLCRYSKTLPGWMGSVAAQLFSGLSRDVRSGSSPGSGWATHGHSFLSRSHSYIFLTVCLWSLSCWKENLCMMSWSLWSRFSSRISLYFALFIFSSILTSLPVPAAEKHPYGMMLPPPCFTIGIVQGFLQTWCLAFMPKSSVLASSDQRILFSLSESPLGAFW